ncbi:MAG: hypothetical protein ACI4V4_05220 [Eubacterium sp.]
MKKTISSLKIGFIYSYIHFAVEVSCFYFLFSRFSDSEIWWGFALLFDALAFVTQGFFGILADKYHKLDYGVLGCLIVLISLILPFDVLALITLGIGNAITHIGGARKTLCTSEGKIAPTSIFVGGGSFGVIIGQLLGTENKNILILIPIIMMIFSILALVCVSRRFLIEEKEWKIDITTKRSASVIVFITFTVVAIRAYIGYAIPTEWKKTEIQAIMLFFIMGIGKIMGGVFADSLGYYKTSLISSVVALPFLLFGNSNMVLSLIGVGLFSMTMPITISILVSKFPKQPCFSFGITTIALFVGTFPAFFIRPTTLLAHQLTVLVLIIIATLSLLICIEKRNKNEINIKDHIM